MSNDNKMTILIAGGTGLVGKHLSRMLRDAGHTVLHLSRRQNLTAEFPAYAWDVERQQVDQAAVDQADCIIHLAGSGVADGRWTPARKRLILRSRVDSTLLLKAAIERRPGPLRAYVAASAIGYYGSRGDQLLTEADPVGRHSFLADTVAQWEQAIAQVAGTGTRTVVIRIGVVLSAQGGALQKMLLPLRFFNAAYFGSGQQWVSWIHLDDICRMFCEAVENGQWSGTYNGVAPHPARYSVFIIELKKAFGKPALVLSVPVFALRAALGEMADVVLESTRAASKKVEQEVGFRFLHPDLLPALRDLLRRKI
jgi:hypothetical protein